VPDVEIECKSLSQLLIVNHTWLLKGSLSSRFFKNEEILMILLMINKLKKHIFTNLHDLNFLSDNVLLGPSIF
jgi:hypothetical protein